MKSYPFTSQVTYNSDGLPQYDRAVNSDFLRKVFAQYFSDGVFYLPATALQVTSGTGMSVQVAPGVCHIQGAIGIEEMGRVLAVQAADSFDRIDTIVARLDLSLAVRSIDLYVVKGTAAETPAAPELARNNTVWELGLANIFVAKETTGISQERITDTRLDAARCGQVMVPLATPDFEPYFAQLTAAISSHDTAAQAQIAELRRVIEGIEAGSEVMLKAVYDPTESDLGVTLQPYTHTKSGTVHILSGSGDNIRFVTSADFTEGDTFKVGPNVCTAQTVAGDDLWTGFFASGAVVVCYRTGDILNFNSAGMPASAKSLLVPENIKYGVHIKGGGIDVVGAFANFRDLGSGNSFNVSSIPNYKNFTVNNFIVEPVESLSGGGSSSGGQEWYINEVTTSCSATGGITKTYNAATGVLTCGGYLTWVADGGYWTHVQGRKDGKCRVVLIENLT